MARAFEVGIEMVPACEDADPMGVVELGTWASHWSSWRESVGPSSVYQEPAWVGSRTLGAMVVYGQGRERGWVGADGSIGIWGSGWLVSRGTC